MKPTTNTTKKLPDEGFKRPWPPLSKTYALMKGELEGLFNPQQPT